MAGTESPHDPSPASTGGPAGAAPGMSGTSAPGTSASGSSGPSAGAAAGGATEGAVDERAQWRGLQGDVENLKDVAAERGRGLIDAARLQAQDYVERRKGDAAQSVHDFARSLRASGREMDDKPNIRAFIDGAADGLEQLGTSIERRSLGEFYSEAEALARRAPVAVAVGTFVAGLIAARFIKSSTLPPEEPSAQGDARDGFRA